MLEPLGFGFDHNQHSLRIVTVLENNYPDFPGLNLTAETLHCLRKHETPWESETATMPHSASLEAQIVNLADEISYYAHDVDDGLRADIVTLKEFFALDIGQMVQKLMDERYPKLTADSPAFRPQLVRSLTHILITDITNHTEQLLQEHRVQTLQDVYASSRPLARYSPDIERATDQLREYLYGHFYHHPSVRAHMEEGIDLIQELFARYHEQPKLLPSNVQKRVDQPDPLPIVIKDYIAGMTDTFLKDTVLGLRKRLV
jgi:dGTPase